MTTRITERAQKLYEAADMIRKAKEMVEDVLQGVSPIDLYNIKITCDGLADNIDEWAVASEE